MLLQSEDHHLRSSLLHALERDNFKHTRITEGSPNSLDASKKIDHNIHPLNQSILVFLMHCKPSHAVKQYSVFLMVHEYFKEIAVSKLGSLVQP